MDTEKIKSIMKMFEESQISKMDLTDGDIHITLEKNVEFKDNILASTPVSSPAVKTSEDKSENQGTEVKSPLVGTYYQAGGVGKEPFVKVGDMVQEGDTICIIEAMKVMNEIKATVSGRVLSIEVQDGQTVEYDQTLMMIG